jgi:hypothetical protein
MLAGLADVVSSFQRIPDGKTGDQGAFEIACECPHRPVICQEAAAFKGQT